jgi:tetratricopeptide (TPR) repeat protein
LYSNFQFLCFAIINCTICINFHCCSFEDAKKSLDDGDYEVAAQKFGSVLEKRFVKLTSILIPLLKISWNQPFYDLYSVEMYGELCPLLAPVYFCYGDCLLEIARSKTDPLGGKIQESTAQDNQNDDGDDDDDDDDDDEKEPITSNSPVLEEDITVEDEAGDSDDATVAFQLLEVARVIYSKLPANQVNELELARVYIRLGDAYCEADNFEAAIEEYSRCKDLRSKYCAPEDRRLSDVLYALSDTYVSLASTTKMQDNELGRKAALVNAQQFGIAAVESLFFQTIKAAQLLEKNDFIKAALEELKAGCLKKVYPVGVTKSVAHPDLNGPSPSGLSTSSTGDIEIHVFRTLFSRYGGIETEEDRSKQILDVSVSQKSLRERCEILDDVLTRLAEISVDMGISISSILHQVRDASGEVGPGITSIGFGNDDSGVSESIGFGESADTSVNATLITARRRPTELPSNGTSTVDASAGVKRERESTEEESSKIAKIE